MKLKSILFSLLIINLWLSLSLVAQGSLYWSDPYQGKIKSINLNSDGEIKDILSQSFIDFQVINFPKSKIYWSDKGKSVISRCNFDGSNHEIVVENLTSPKGITIDLVGNLFFIDDDKIFMTNSEGDNKKIIVSGLSSPTDLIFWNDLIYWTDIKTDKIESIKADGTDRNVVLSNVINPIDIEVNKQTSKLFWVQYTGGIPGSGIFRADINGTNIETVVEEFAQGIYIDGESNLLYWSESIFNTINRFNLLDQSSSELISEYLPRPKSISIDKSNNKIYYSDNRYGGLIYEANLTTGKSVSSIVNSEVYLPDRIEIDTINNMLYWINSKSSAYDDKRSDIMRSNLDGQNIERLITYPEIKRAEGLALDVTNNLMYWTDRSSSTISSSNLDGSNIQILVTGLDNVTGLTLDYKNKKLYWGDWGTKKIQRSDLDGSNVEDIIISDLSIPKELAIYYKGSKLYWSDSGNGTINRSNLDGTNIENIITTENPDFNRPNSIFIDEKNDKIFYSIDFSGKKIQKANIDGTNIEDIVTENFDSAGDLFLVYKKSNSIINQDNTNTISIFPNPSNNIFNFKSNFILSNLKIFNSTGILMYSIKDINSLNHSVSTANFPEGIYHGIVYSNEQKNSFKIIKLK